jgi:hypothetical protein
LVPKNTKLLSRNKKVTSSDDWIITGELYMITDGAWRLGARDVEVQPGFEWIQIDLEESHVVSAIVMWRLGGQRPDVYKDVIILVSDAENFDQHKVIFNNDRDNSSGFGKGTDPEYVENPYGSIINGKNTKGRYIRIYSNGSYYHEPNRYKEVEVYGYQPQKKPNQSIEPIVTTPVD